MGTGTEEMLELAGEFAVPDDEMGYRERDERRDDFEDIFIGS